MKKTVIIPIVALPAAAVLLAASTMLVPNDQTTLDKLAWKSVPEIISIDGVDRQGHNGLLLMRLKDGKEQFIAGTWKTSYTRQGNLLVVGDFPAGYSSSTAQHLYAVKGNKIISLSLEKLKQPVTSVQESPNQAYLFFGTKNDNKTDYCVMEWEKSQPAECQSIKLDNITKGRWNQSDKANGHELLVETASGTIYSADPWEKGLDEPKAISPDQEPKRNNQAIATLTDNEPLPDNTADTPNHKTYLRFYNLVLIKDGSKWSIHRVPPSSELYWLNDGGHLLIKEKNKLSVYEIATRSSAPLLSEDNIGSKSIRYRNKPDQTL